MERIKSMDKKTMLLIFNPKAGLEAMRMNLYEVLSLLSANGFLVTMHPTTGKKDAYHRIRELAPYYDYIVCSGGDGTLNEAVDALMSLEERPLFGYIPAGTTNDFATSLGLPTDVLQATSVLYQGQPREIDVGKFQTEHFSYVAAFGLFADVSYGTSQGLKNMFGHAAYVLEGMRRLGNIRSWHCRVEADGTTYEDDFIFGMVTNSASVGGFTLPSSVNESGEGFKLILLKKMSTLSDLQKVIATLLGREYHPEHFVITSVKDVTIYSDAPLDWTLDGEYGGSFTKTDISILPKALSIMAPKPEEEILP